MSNTQKVCPNGHYYDSSLSKCPFCGAKEAINPTDAFVDDSEFSEFSFNDGDNSNVNYDSQQEMNKTNPVSESNWGQNNSFEDQEYNDTGKTEIVGKLKEDKSFEPVVGWLVCVKGKDIGKDYRLHANNNFVGRAHDQDVRITDPKVSRVHFTVSYDPVNNVFFAYMGRGKAIVYINGKPLGSTTVLRKGDKIRVADTELVFIPLEQELVRWEWA